MGTGAATDTEVFGYDHLGRLARATTYVDESRPGASSTVDRSLSYGYDRLGNPMSMPGATLAYAGTGNAGPNAATSATGVAKTISYDTSGHVTRYDAATGDDTFVEWNGRGLASRITVGTSKTDASPTARDEFRYGPAGERYYRRTMWTETVTGDGGTSTTRTRWAEVYRVGGYEKVVGDGLGPYAWVDKTRAGAAQLLRTAATATATPTSAVEYLHGDHLGSLAAATDASGASLLSLAHDPYGARRKADWTALLPASDIAALAAGQDAGRARNGFTGHETLDRTGFVHMGGRLYDPRLGRFLSPDPIVSEPWSGQGWNLYSYVGNSPTSRTDPTGYCYAAGPLCQLGQGGGFTNVTQAFTALNVSWRIPVCVTVTWGRVSFGIGGSLWSGDGGGFFGRGGFFWPRVTLRFGLPFPVFDPREVLVSLGQEMSPADERIVGGVVAGGKFVWDFVIGDAIGTGMEVYGDLRTGDYGGAAIGTLVLGCDVLKPCKVGDKLLKLGKRIPVHRRLAAPTGILTKPTASNRRLQGVFDELYDPGDKIAGGTARAVRHELATGTLVGGRTHSIKARERVSQLRRILREEDLGPGASSSITRCADAPVDVGSANRQHPSVLCHKYLELWEGT